MKPQAPKINFSQVRSFGKGLQQAEAKNAATISSVSVRETSLQITDIQDRAGGNTRDLNLPHLVTLAESIQAIGLIEPLAVDRENRLLAGGHRLAALRLLAISPSRRREHVARIYLNWSEETLQQAQHTEVWGSPVEQELLARIEAVPQISGHVPVHVMELDSTTETELALAIEIAENEKRRDYSKTEIQSLADRLRSAGYRHVVGRPKSNEKSLFPALESIVGKSRSTLLRALSDEKIASDDAISPNKESGVVRLEKSLSQMLKRFLKATKGEGEARNAQREAASLLLQALQSTGEET
jgi:ParB family chromosome partitioning protein